ARVLVGAPDVERRLRRIREDLGVDVGLKLADERAELPLGPRMPAPAIPTLERFIHGVRVTISEVGLGEIGELGEVELSVAGVVAVLCVSAVNHHLHGFSFRSCRRGWFWMGC